MGDEGDEQSLAPSASASNAIMKLGDEKETEKLVFQNLEKFL